MILDRLARTLAEATGWTLDTKPHPGADLNYYFPYLVQEGYFPFATTPTAAWFTHQDVAMPGKLDLWRAAAERVGLRTVTAPMYLTGLLQYGPTVTVTPPLDRQHFAIGKDTTNHTIGVAGWCYASGRKGQGMVKQLVADGYPVRAAGHGWPCDTRMYPWAELPAFYQGLGVFVSTSNVEGVGYPPMEALACGIPVVVPRGVGIYDTFPDEAGIYRYDVGDYAGLRAGIDAALATEHDRELLRSHTARFTVAAWAGDHRLAFEDAVGNLPYAAPQGPWVGRAGVYVVAFGEPSRACARACIAAVKRTMPGLPVALAAVTPLGAGEDVFIPHPDSDIGGRTAKLRVDELAPAAWEYVLYLDADTEPAQPFGALFDHLASGWEFLICKDMQRFALVATMRRPDNRAESDETISELGSDQLTQYNGGVFAFRRCPRTKEFFQRWFAEWQRWGKRDQGALLRALYHQPLRMLTLSNVWNASDRYPAPPNVAIWHHNIRARRWRGIVPGRLDGPAAWAAVANFTGQAE
jgi:hypothetical protein